MEISEPKGTEGADPLFPLEIQMWWQAAKWPAPICLNSGSSLPHNSVAKGHLVLKRQPLGGFKGLGTSPSSTILFLLRLAMGSGIGIADISDLV